MHACTPADRSRSQSIVNSLSGALALLHYDENELAASFHRIMRRYEGATPAGFTAVLCPLLVQLKSFDTKIFKRSGESHWRASFTVELTEGNCEALVRGRTGKLVPGDFAKAGVWREIAKGRIITVNEEQGFAEGEIYTGGTKADLENAVAQLDGTELLEIDQFGAAAKVLSGLAEFELVRIVKLAGYTVRRMPEDMAKHLGSYRNYDFEFTKAGVTKKVEVKSIWGTNTRCARLIHSTTKRPVKKRSAWTEEQRRNYYPTSSCKFATQDIFAVSLFLRTGNIGDFAFARSIPRTTAAPHGLPAAKGYPEHVSQNPLCEIGKGSWFGTIDEVWNLP
jgi:hypothetical protein